jgi:chloramphenicol-sensitive protein RarD
MTPAAPGFYHRLLPKHTTTPTPSPTGLALAVTAFGWWGVIMPIYLGAVKAAPLEQLAQRVVFGVPAALILIVAARAWPELRETFRSKHRLAVLAASTVFMAGIWIAFIYAVATGRLMDASLGYYTAPLVSVALGMIFLGERQRPLEWLGIALAVVAVAVIAWQLGTVPWIALTIAFCFAAYGLVRKKAHTGPLVGVTVELIFLFPFAVALYLWLGTTGAIAITAAPPVQLSLMLAAGFVVIVPFLSFAGAARRLRLSTLGILQYIAPTGQMLVALINGEALTPARIIAFALIWLALACYGFDALKQRRT